MCSKYNRKRKGENKYGLCNFRVYGKKTETQCLCYVSERKKNYSLVKKYKFCKEFTGAQSAFSQCDLLDLRFVDNLLADNFLYAV